jgi:hypothetical protein
LRLFAKDREMTADEKPKGKNVKLAQTKLALARKYEILAKVSGSKPRRARMARHAERYRRQAEDLARQ